ncbi:MAG: type II secretion system F family protein [Opitutaceae bacterium]|nr:type II secretion system F family protein [Cephaloticoccus sp.]MCP5530469.1 type II secretion system F family protein [Opitutaceae bacterium]
MTAFTATFLDPDGRRHTDTFHASDIGQLRTLLRRNSLWLIQARPETKARGPARLILPHREFISALHQLELQLRSGVTADLALSNLASDAPKGKLRTLLSRIAKEVARGRPIHEACGYFSRQFPPHFTAVIAAGETSARLPEALRGLADHLSSMDRLKRTARRALVYPLIVLVATTGLILFLLGGVVPKFAEIFASLHLPLPGITRLLIQSSHLVVTHWPQLAVAAFLMVLTGWLVPHSARLSHWRDFIGLKLPVWGETIRCLATARFAAHCRLLHSAGVPLLDCLATARDLINQRVLAGQLDRARKKVARGHALYAALPPKHDFPGFLIPVLKSGETSGQLGSALHHIETYAQERAQERIATALALLEPCLLALLTTVVGAIALAFFIPLFSLLGGIQAR